MLSDKTLRFRTCGRDNAWLLYALRSSWGRNEIERLSTGNQHSMRNIGQDRIRAIRIPLPPLLEQRRIVAEIEKQFTRIEEGSSGLEEARRKLRTLSLSASDAVQPLQASHETRRKLRDVATLIQYGSSAKTGDDPEGVPIIRMGNITKDGRIAPENLKYLPPNHAEFPALLLEDGDLLFNRTNSAELVGKSAVYHGSPSPCSFASYLIRVRTRENCLPDFLAASLNSPYGRRWITSVVSQQVGQANVNGTKLANFEFAVPSVTEQRDRIQKFERTMSLIRELQSSISKQEVRAARLRQAILAKAFSGQLVPQDPHDEPASVLLERIRADRQRSATIPIKSRRAQSRRPQATLQSS